MQLGRPYGAKLRPAPGIRLERSIVRRDANRPELAEGERTLIELDPDKVAAALREFRRAMNSLNRLVSRSPRRRRRRSR
jgi:hypothetical protein